MEFFLVNSRNQSTRRNLEKLKLKYEPIKREIKGMQRWKKCENGNEGVREKRKYPDYA